MYSTKEKLHHFQQLTNPLAAEADLALLHKKYPQNADFTRFDLAPRKNAEDILFALLDVADHDDIVRNRREFLANVETKKEAGKNVDNSETESSEELLDDVEAVADSNVETTTDPTEEVQTVIPSDEVQAQETANLKPATEKKSRSPKKKSTPK
jgi:hypothetical protein